MQNSNKKVEKVPKTFFRWHYDNSLKIPQKLAEKQPASPK